MLTETKIPASSSLIPVPGQSMEAARDSHYGRIRQPEQIVNYTRSPERGSMFLKAASYLGILAAAATLAGAEVYNHLTQPKTKEVSMLVKPYDNPTTVAQRAEDRFGKDSGEFNIHQEALRLADKYGVLHAGEHLKVFVK